MITVVTAATKSYKDTAIRLIESLKQAGYPYVIFDLDNLGFGEKFEDVFGVKMPLKHIRRIYAWKPAMILNVFKREKSGTVVWIDADAVVIDRFDEMAIQDYDFAISVHRTKLSLNAGVLFFNRTMETRLWLWRLVKSTPRFGGKLHKEGDQNTLERLLSRYHPDYRRLVGKVVDHDGLRLKFVPAEIYNNADPQGGFRPKILHMPGGGLEDKEERWEKYRKWMNK